MEAEALDGEVGYNFPAIAYTSCNDKRKGKKSKCADPTEADKFFRSHALYFVHQETSVLMEMFPEHELVQKYPHYGDGQNYFPTTC